MPCHPRSLPIPADWPFADPENLAVFTLKGIVRGESPILRVTHDDFLIAALGDPHPAVWKQALDGLVVIASPEAEHRLRAVAGRLDAEDEQRAWFEEAIEQITEAAAPRMSWPVTRTRTYNRREERQQPALLAVR